MPESKALELLIGWFGYEPFRIVGMSEQRVDELEEVLGSGGSNSIGRRTNIGKYLTSIDRQEFRLSNGKQAKLVVRVRGVGDDMGQYQVKLVA